MQPSPPPCSGLPPTTPRPEIRPATEADIRRFYGSVKWTFRAFAAELDGEVLAVAGIYYDWPHVVAFSSVKPGANDRYKFTAGRMVMKVMELVRARTCYAVIGPSFPESGKLLERLGFEHVEGRIYRWTPASSQD